jgi:transposase
MTVAEIRQLSEGEKTELLLALWTEVQVLRARNAQLEAEVKELRCRLNEPAKDSHNSSVPPGRTQNRNKPASASEPKGVRREASVGRAGGGRTLAADPDQYVEAKAGCCPVCGWPVDEAGQRVQAVYDKIELPPIRPIITRVTQYGGQCPHCASDYVAPVPVGLEAGTPFGRSIQALAVYRRYNQAISYERLAGLFGEVFGLAISEGALANLFQGVKPRLEAEVTQIVERLRASRLVCSDETSARVNGRNQWEWGFQNPEVCVHLIRPSRGHGVIDEVFGGDHAKPAIGVSDLYSAQRQHPAQDWQVCLAHQLRDCQFAIEAGDTIFAPGMKRVLLRAFVIHRWREELSDEQLERARAELARRLQRCLQRQPTNKHGQRLHKRYTQIKEHLFVFLRDGSIPPTNNSSEQAIRLSVIFRKVTNGFRSDWGRDLFAAIRSVVNTGKRQGLSAYQAIKKVVGANGSLFAPG